MTARRAARGAWVTVIVLVVSACTTSAKNLSATATSAGNHTARTTRLSVGAVTAAQLDAHLGVGVPTGWEPADAGAARVWVPNGWTLEPRGSCVGGASVGMISIGDLPQANCAPSSQWPIPAEAVALVPSSLTGHGPATLTVHGYRIFKVETRTMDAAWSYYDVPQLGVQIATHGRLGRGIIDTLAPSARTIALDPAFERVPDGWRPVTNDGVTTSIPPAWSVETPTSSCGSPFLSDSALQLITPHIEFAPCPPPPPNPAAALHDGISLFVPPHNPNVPSPTGHPNSTLHHGKTTITICAEVGDSNALDLFVHQAGDAITHAFTLGLGRDGRTAGGILASIRAST